MPSDPVLFGEILLLLLWGAWLASGLRLLSRARFDGGMPPSQRRRLLVLTVCLFAAILLLLPSVLSSLAFHPVPAR